VCLYTVAAQGDRRRSVIVAVVAAGWAGGLSLATGSPSGTPAAEAAWPVLALLLGEVVRMRREQLAGFAERAARAEADRDAEARRRVQDERLRIARELHDVVAHTVAAMNVQASLAADAFDDRPEVARAAIAQVRASGREAMSELHATVSLLRDHGEGGGGGDAAVVAPAPRLDEVDRLAVRASTGDLVVDVDRDGVRDLPPVIEMAAYRIVQEALTNVIRHAGARRAQVRLRCAGGNLEVEVTDDGPGPAPAGDDLAPPAGVRRGFGLVGMRERAASVGGHVDAGPAAGGGFRVRAVLPVPGPGVGSS
jgi:signal transduction histidine kinase